ncbi:MAG: BACON domain-containing protein [Bacteroidales bacterium]|nr:BACON domain-containing protein [Bacteroidales bacterium]
MKITKILTGFAAAALLVACTPKQIARSFDNIKVDKTQVILAQDATEGSIKVTATEDWEVVASSIPEGLTVTPTSGKAGETTVTFSYPDAVSKELTVNIQIICGTNAQFVLFKKLATPSPYPEFEAGNYWIMAQADGVWKVAKPLGLTIDDSSSYGYIYVDDAKGDLEKGLTSTEANIFTFEATTGGFYIKDSAGGYLYMDSAGKYNNFYQTSKTSNAFVWTVKQVDDYAFEITSGQGKWMQYSTGYSSYGAYNTPQTGGVLPYLVPAKDPAPEVLTIKTPTITIGKDGGAVAAAAVINVDTFKALPEESWIHYVGFDKDSIYFSCDANDKAGRSAKVNIEASLGEFTSTGVITIEQEGAVEDKTAAEINAAPDDNAVQYRLTGYICKVANPTAGNIYIVDHTDTVYVYGVLDGEGAKGKFDTLGISEGDIVTVQGVKGSYKGDPQMVSVTVVSHKKVTDITAAAFNALADDTETWYRVSGTVTDGSPSGHKWDLTTYGNFDLVDETGAVYVYGCTYGWGGPAKMFGTLEIAAGDDIKIVCHKGSYKEAPQATNAFYVGVYVK